MAYVRKMLAHDEKMIGIARLHWIYVIKGLVWFLGLAFFGWAVDQLMTRSLYIIAQSAGTSGVTATLMSFSQNIMLFMMAAGFGIFALMVVKVLVTEVGLSNRRILYKEGLLFVKVQQIDLEEIRGENVDTGHLGRLLGYAYIMLDCRFIGDIRLPALEHPARFIRALHQMRTEMQDSLVVMLGKGNPRGLGPVESVIGGGDGPDKPAPKQPTPEIQPGQQPQQPEVSPPNTPKPEINPPPVPHSPPAPESPPPEPQGPPQQPQQPTPAPINPEPPLQPPTDTKNNIALPPETVAQVVAQIMPQMAQEVVKEMEHQGLLHHDEEVADNDNHVDTDLMDSFDEARLEKGKNNNDLRDKMEYAIH